jgi:hypothetical protein
LRQKHHSTQCPRGFPQFAENAKFSARKKTFFVIAKPPPFSLSERRAPHPARLRSRTPLPPNKHRLYINIPASLQPEIRNKKFETHIADVRFCGVFWTIVNFKLKTLNSRSSPHPERVPEISRGVEQAIPPENDKQIPTTPERVAEILHNAAALTLTITVPPIIILHG